MPTKYRDYAGMFPNYQALGNQKAQSYQNNANTVGQLLQALSAIAQKNQMMSEADNYFSGGVTNAPTMQPNFGQQGATPIGENFDGQVAVQGRTAMPNPMMAEPSISPRSQDPQTLIRGLMNANPEIARRAQAGIQGIQLQAPNRQALSPYGTEDVNQLSPTRGQRTEPIEKPKKYSQKLTEFMTATGYDMDDPKSFAEGYKAFNDAEQKKFESKENFKTGEKKEYRRFITGEQLTFDRAKLRTAVVDNPETDQKEVVVYLGGGKANTIPLAQIKRQMTDGDKDAFVYLNGLNATLDEIEKLYKPEYVGNVFSNGLTPYLNVVKQKSGDLPREQNDFYRELENSFNESAFAKGGKALTNIELDRIKSAVGSRFNSPEDFEAGMRAARREINSILNKRSELLKKGVGGAGGGGGKEDKPVYKITQFDPNKTYTREELKTMSPEAKSAMRKYLEGK